MNKIYKDYIINLVTRDDYCHYISDKCNDDNVNLCGHPICSMPSNAKFFTKDEAEIFCKNINDIFPKTIEIGKGQTMTITDIEIICLDDAPNKPLHKISSEHNYIKIDNKLD